MVGVHGRGDGAPIESRGGMSFDLPQEIVEHFEQFLAMEHSQPPLSYRKRAESFAQISLELTHLEEEAFEELLAESQLPKHEVLALGVVDPGVWDISPHTPSSSPENPVTETLESGPSRVFRSFSNPELLAERTGMTIVDSFASRDIACGGTGGPLFPFPAWIVLCSEEKDRVLLDLGRNAKWTFLPHPGRPSAHELIEYGEIAPCGSLFDAGTLRLTQTRQRTDTEGTFTARGRVLPELLKSWNTIAAAHGNSRKLWVPGGFSPEPYVKAFEEFFVSHNLGDTATKEEISPWDYLATCVPFIVESIAAELKKRFTKSAATFPMEILLTGGTLKNKPFEEQLRSRLQSWTCRPIAECGLTLESLEAVSVAILTLLFADQIPAAVQGITGAQSVQPLGRITPGSPRSWTRFLEEMAQSRATARSLRSAM